jgi:hypothetical protein
MWSGVVELGLANAVMLWHSFTKKKMAATFECLIEDALFQVLFLEVERLKKPYIDSI